LVNTVTTTWGFPCCVWSPLPACRRHYPGRTDKACSLVLLHRHRPSPVDRRVGSCIIRFEACSAFTRVTACMLTESPLRLLHRRLQRLRYLHRCFDCYRAERTSSRAGLPPAVDQRLFTAHCRLPRLAQFRGSIPRPTHSLSTLRRADCSAATQDSLPDGWPSLSGQTWISARSLRKVSGYIAHIILLVPSFPGAPQNWAQHRVVDIRDIPHARSDLPHRFAMI